MNNENLKPVQELTPFTKMIMTIGVLPTSFYSSMSYYESMVWLYEYLKNNVIPTVNNNAEAVIELQEKFIELKEWTENYLEENLPEEVKEKLDEMATDGTLQSLLDEIMKYKGLQAFNNVEEMKTSTNLVEGSFAETYGFYQANDEGKAKYKIRLKNENDVIDEAFLISLNDNTLVAELIIEKFISIKQLGAKGDGITDDTDIFKIGCTSTLPLFINSGTYIISDTIEINNIEITGNGEQSLLKAIKDFEVNYPIVKIINKDNISISNFSISGNIEENPIGEKYSGDQGITLLGLTNCSNIKIEKINFIDNAYCGIVVFDTDISHTLNNIKILNNNFLNIDCGIISLGSNYSINNLEIFNNYYNGHANSEPISIYHIGTSKNIIISNNIISNKYMGNGILFTRGTSTDVIITDNIIDNVATGMTLHNITNLNVANNIIKSESEHTMYNGILLNGVSNYKIHDNLINYLSLYGIKTESSSYGEIYNNKIININALEDQNYIAGILIDGNNNLKCYNNYAKRYGSTNTLLYNVLGSISYLSILELCNISDVTIGIQMSGLSSAMTNSIIDTNLSINGNFNASYVSSNTNYIIQRVSVSNILPEYQYRYKFLRDITLEFASSKTISTFTIYNLREAEVFNLNIIPNGLVTLTNDTSSDFGITWLTERSFATPTQLKLMYHNGKLYEV